MNFFKNIQRMQTWNTLSKKTILDHSEFLRVEYHEVQLPDGRIIPDWPWIITPDFVIIIATNTAGDYLMFRQTKYAIEGDSYAPVGGYLDQGEDPLLAAQRELLEETGYTAEKWHALGEFMVDGNRGAGKGYLFLAIGADQVADVNSDDLEEQVLHCLSRQEIEAALDAGEIKLMPWVAAVTLALRFQGNRL